MQVITIVQTKGGSGKTTSAMLLASAALDAGRQGVGQGHVICRARAVIGDGDGEGRFLTG